MKNTKNVSFGAGVQISIPGTWNVLYLCSSNSAKYCYFVHFEDVTGIPLVVISASALDDKELEHIALCAPKITI